MIKFSQFGKKLVFLLVINIIILHLPAFTPTLQAMGNTELTLIINGSGVEGDPFLISTVGELAFMAQQVNAGVLEYRNGHFRLTNDINLSVFGSTHITSHFQGWTPIAGAPLVNGRSYAFGGVFDGGNYTISGLFTNMLQPMEGLSSDRAGLFGTVTGTVKNLRVEGTVISSAQGVGTGGVVGWLVGGEIYNVHFNGSVRGESSTGGIVGRSSSGRIVNSHSEGEVRGWFGASNGGFGGIAGDISNSTILNSSSSSTVEGLFDTGGIVGRLGTNSRVENSLALNPWVYVRCIGIAGQSVGRIVGGIANGATGTTLYNNYARVDMGVNGGSPFRTPPEIYNAHNNLNGADIPTNAPPAIPIISVQIASPASLRLEIGESYALTAIVNPTNATNQNVTWASDNPVIATVANGVVTGVSQGHTIVRVIAECGNGAIYDTIVVEVIPVASLTLGDVIRLAEARVQANYTPLSWMRMQSALNAARITYNNPTANQALYENRKSNLLAMLDALVLR